MSADSLRPPPADDDGDDAFTPSPGVRFSRSDFELLRRAARRDWGTPDPLKTEALWQAALCLCDPTSRPRLKASAQRFLLAADRNDLFGQVAYARLEWAKVKDGGAVPGDDTGCDPTAAAAALKAARETYGDTFTLTDPPTPEPFENP